MNRYKIKTQCKNHLIRILEVESWSDEEGQIFPF